MNVWADWLIRQRFVEKETISPLGLRVAELLGRWYGGIYHANPKYMKEADWTSEDYIQLKYHGTLSTFDGDDLTRLVFLAHDLAIRVEISAVGGPSKLMRLVFYNRQRDGDWFNRHPSMEEALKAWRERAQYARG